MGGVDGCKEWRLLWGRTFGQLARLQTETMTRRGRTRSGNSISSRFVNFPVTWIYVEVFRYNCCTVALLATSASSSIPHSSVARRNSGRSSGGIFEDQAVKIQAQSTIVQNTRVCGALFNPTARMKSLARTLVDI